MSMSTSVVGIRQPDEKWKKMKAAWDACVDANVSPPKGVAEFFNHEPPDDDGIRVHLTEGDNPVAKEWKDNSSDGYQIAIADLPKNITHIRFYNSW